MIFKEYKLDVLSKTSGANIHKVSNLLQIMQMIIECPESFGNNVEKRMEELKTDIFKFTGIRKPTFK